MADDGSGNGGGAQRRGGYLGFVAHEVRNPLSTALWSAELLSRMAAEERGGARGEKLSGMCLRSIARVRQLLEDHLLCERLDAGGMPLRFEQVEGAAVVQAVLGRLPDGIGPVTSDLAAGGAALVDRALAERAVEALVAVAGRDGTEVKVAVRPDGGMLGVVVTGAAPLPGALEDPVKGSPSDQRGRALALPVVRRIATALGGTLDTTETGYILLLPRAGTYAARPTPAPSP